jgi:uncharacterized protein YndB with AHSA1/START domain
MAAKSNEAATTSDREIVTTRLFDAPRGLVFEAWTRPEHAAQWWGPDGFTNTIHEMDVRPGGVWRFIMHGPDGVDYKNKIVFIEVVKPERLVFSHGGEGEDEQEPFHVAVTFAEEGGKTRVTMRAVFGSAAERNRVVELGAIEGGNQTLARLDEYLAKMASPTSDREIVMTRVFDAPRLLVFQVWTDPAHVAQWWGPDGFTNTIYEMDVRPGGVWRFVMHGPDGVDYQNKIVFIEIVRPERLVYSHTGGAQFHTTVTFDDEQGGKTRLTVRMLFESAAEHDRVVRKFGAIEGLKQTLGRLAAYLAKM